MVSMSTLRKSASRRSQSSGRDATSPTTMLSRRRTVWIARWKGNDLTPDRLVGPVCDTKSQCSCWIKRNYGYIKTRKDLRGPPHYWRLPVPAQCEQVETEL